MAQCATCGAETQLHDNGVPLCVRCCEQRESSSLAKLGVDLTQARQDYQKAMDEVNRLTAIYDDVPTASPDGTIALGLANKTLHDAGDRLRNAASAYSQRLKS